jgi:ribosomal-protein-alanine acetyltransferase
VIAGRNPELYHSEPPPDPRIEFHGFIADVRPFYVAANLVVVPTRVSAGTNLKVLEAMAMERAVLSTPSGCAGLDLVPGESVWIAETAEELARAVDRLLSDEDLRRQLAGNARRVATERYSWERIGRAQRQLWNAVISGIIVRNAVRSDASELERIQQASHGASQWEPESYFRFDVKVAMVGGSIRGFMVTRMVASDEAEILNIAVAPESRRLGVATALIESLNVPEAFLEVRESNDVARALYEKLGFREAGRREDYYDDPVESAIVMRRGSDEMR